ncbi:hypothetical protein [Mesorhizobium sp. B2-3-10]|uniref:hypothetical protein n=1 Tax=Mesorhizobium sp. B2-3-10 TaxID=2589954 RepID=UPI00112B06D4|nr:hypothetical protein [Mesorhizobium sp. B2-3-10]TPL98323.1 hypothetical protein FJ943_15575 [Mesorhizobium sp. B2-3-10]
MNLIPATLGMLDYTGMLEHPEAREFMSLWGGGEYAVLDDGEPYGLVAIKEHPESPTWGWGNAWVIPARRGHWLTDEVREKLKAFLLAHYDLFLAATDNPVCGRFLRRNGFNIYCQKDSVSYYSLAREVQ